jgi:hypothetical protein
VPSLLANGCKGPALFAANLCVDGIAVGFSLTDAKMGGAFFPLTQKWAVGFRCPPKKLGGVFLLLAQKWAAGHRDCPGHAAHIQYN